MAERVITQAQRRRYLLEELIQESPEYSQMGVIVPESETAQRELLRALFNTRPPRPASTNFLKVQDEYLKECIRQKGITESSALSPIAKRTYLWRGDITTLRCDAIVNAANKEMLGCFIPGHSCIDNAVHTFAGVQLRLECAKIMRQQGHPEPTGGAKITDAYNLPSRKILHTVGPIVERDVTRQDETMLACCYRSCLRLAERSGMRSIAFCCISTGVFHFPATRAARIAVAAVERYRAETGSQIDVIYNVFTEEDFDIYHDIL